MVSLLGQEGGTGQAASRAELKYTILRIPISANPYMLGLSAYTLGKMTTLSYRQQDRTGHPRFSSEVNLHLGGGGRYRHGRPSEQPDARALRHRRVVEASVS